MNRRRFLAASSALAAGCGRGVAPPVPVPTAAAGPSLAAQTARRREHLAALERFRVPASATRTTPPPAVVVPDVFPQLKPLVRYAVRLHPRFSDEPGPTESKVGGRFAWPAGEPPPADLAPVLQLRADDAPTQVVFRPGTDLLQLFWDRSATNVRVFWRKRADCPDVLDPPPVERFPADALPVPCRVFPEKVAEYPPPPLMPRQMRERLAGWAPPAGADGPGYYADRLSAAPGTKVGGWPRWDADPRTPTCPVCQRLTDFLLTVDASEWTDRTHPRWRPTEERDAADAEGYRAAVGLRLGGGGWVNVFVCRTCEGWPAYSVGG